MDVPDPRTRSQISLSPQGYTTGSGRPKALGQTALASAVTAGALFAGRQWLLLQDVGVFWLLVRVLACGGIAAFGWAAWTDQLKHARRKSVEWTILGVASLAFLVQQASLLTALLRLSSLRILILTHMFTLVPRSLSSSKRTRRWIAALAAIVLSFVSDIRSKPEELSPIMLSYASLGVYALATLALEHTQGSLVPALGADLASAATTLGAACLAAPLYGFRRIMADVVHHPTVPMGSLAVIPLLALAFTHLRPNITRALRTISVPSAVFRLSFPSALGTSALLAFLTSFYIPSVVDIGTSALVYYAFSGKLHVGAPSRTPAMRLARMYMKTILSNPESRKIFYFLVLNMVYMGVQMVYGVWTNSLGLISDAIHMAFDCMAIGVGLIASVMATWDPNERFTYGYGRIETLSGFANGIFLILISIFIIFEAIERLIDPPEMQTDQLLLVSSVGLGVNLFGLFAMGGHHHHGHSHSHGHSHGGGDDHGHSHGSVEEKGHGDSHASPPLPSNTSMHTSHNHSSDHGHSHDAHGHEQDHGHSHDDHNHGHSHDSHDRGHSHEGHSDSQDDHAHEHSHDGGDDHSHSPAVNGHSHEEECGHSHDHSHSQSRDDHDHRHSPNADSGHAHDGGHGHSHDGGNGVPHELDHGHTHGNPKLPAARRPGHTKRFSGPALRIPPPEDETEAENAPPSSAFAKSLLSAHGGGTGVNGVPSPITPSYSFVHDEHYERVHAAESGPNLHSHGHGHGHEGHSDNMRGVFLHVLADTMGSVGVIISTLLIKFYGWTGFDPIASLFIAVLIIASVVPLVVDTGRILALDVSSRRTQIDDGLAEVAAVPGVARYESPRFWPKDGNSYVGSIRILLARAPSSVDVGGPHGAVGANYVAIDKVVERVDSVLKAKIRGLDELTIEVDGE